MCQFLRDNAGEWSDAEHVIADKIVAAMGGTPAKRRDWLVRLRRKFYDMDSVRACLAAMSSFAPCAPRG